MLTNLKALYTTEPTRVVTLLAAVVVFVLAKAGIVVDSQDVGDALLLVLPILLGGEVVRAKVSPAQPAELGGSDELLPTQVLKDLKKVKSE